MGTDALHTLAAAVAAAGRVDHAALDADGFRAWALGLQQQLDRLTVVHARVLAHGQDHGLFSGTGCRSMADWLAKEAGTSVGETLGKIRLANALDNSDALRSAVDSGEMSPATAGVIAAAVNQPPTGVTADDLDALVDTVKGSDPKQARAALEKWKHVYSESVETPEQREARLHSLRSLKFNAPEDGMISGTFRLPTLNGREVMTAIGHLARKQSEDDDRTLEQRMADGLLALCDAYAKGTVTGGRERPQLILTANVETLTGQSNDPGRTLYGDLVPAHLIRRYAENSDVHTVIKHGNNILALTTASRFASEAQWRALVARDGCCRWAGCNAPASKCEIDHLQPVEDGGLTELLNLVLFCRNHHTLKHQPGTEIIGNAHNLQIRLPNGQLLHCPPKPLPTPAAA